MLGRAAALPSRGRRPSRRTGRCSRRDRHLRRRPHTRARSSSLEDLVAALALGDEAHLEVLGAQDPREYK